MIIPAVKKQEIGEGKCYIQGLFCFGERKITNFGVEYLKFFFNGEIAFSERKEEANVFFVLNNALNNGAYSLHIEESIQIEYFDAEGARNALATLLQLIRPNGSNGYVLQRQTIEDYTDCKYRSLMIDLARGLPPIDVLKEDLRIASLAKCNSVHFHLMDSAGLCYRSDVIKIREKISGTELYSKEEIKEIAEYCDKLGLKIVPEIEVPAHASGLVSCYPELKCQTNVKEQSNWVVCAGKEETFELFEKLIAEICQLFPSEYIHIGGDELYFDDLTEVNNRCHWEDCVACRKRMAEEGIEGKTGLYYYVVNRIHEIVKGFGRKVILWNDQIDISKPVPLSRDCIVQFWMVTDETRGPREGCSYRKFLEEGFKVICSPFEYCYIDLEDYANPEKIASFNYVHYDNSAEYKDQVIGCETCAWEYGNPNYTHYKYSLKSASVLLLAKMWDTRNVVYDREYRCALSKLLLGYLMPDDYDLFEIFGSIMPPRLNDRSTYFPVKRVWIDKITFQKNKRVLSELAYTYSPLYLAEILKIDELNLL